MWQYNQTPYICHYGVKGMKWGVRKITRAKPLIQNRKAQKSDIKDITDMLDGLPQKDKKFLALDTKYSVIKQAIKDGRHCTIATDNGKVVGFLRESGRPKGFNLLEELVVIPEYRGKGIASKLLDDFHEVHPKALATTKADNNGMITLLKKKGYKPINPGSKRIIHWVRE